ncbi:MAG: DUF3168 domain-containing protein [Planctomycetota bacterium]
MSLEAVQSAIDDALRADTAAGGVAALVGGRVYEDAAPDDAPLPLVRHAVVTNPAVFSLQADRLEIEFQVDTYAERFDRAAARAVAGAVDALLHRGSLSVAGFSGGQVLRTDAGVPSTEDELCRVRQRFRLFANQ